MSKNRPILSTDELFPTFVFVTHGGPLEAKSALLAASLGEYYIPKKLFTRIMMPEERWGALGEDTVALFHDIGVEMQAGENEIDLNYPHGNKITSMRGLDGPCIFLDSDMLMMAPFTWHYCLNADAALKPADLDTFSAGGGSWARVWDAFGMEIPPKTWKATLSQEKMRPYFNAGFISVKNGNAFSEVWLEVAREIDQEVGITNKRPWLDQIALPVALKKLGWQPRELEISFNFPNHLTGMAGGLPYISHYHWPKVIAKEPALLSLVTRLVKKHPTLTSIMSRYDEWRVVTEKIDI